MLYIYYIYYDVLYVLFIYIQRGFSKSETVDID